MEDTSSYPKHTELADFMLDKDGQLICSLNINFTDFDININQYLHGDSEITEQEYELIYSEVAKKCNETGEYTIDCFNDRYTVRKTSEIEQIRYEAMTEEEKIEYDKQTRIRDLRHQLEICENEFKELDYIGVKIATGRATIEDYSVEIARMNELAKQKDKIKNELLDLE